MKKVVLPLALSLLLSMPAQAAIRSAYEASIYEKKLGNAYKIGTVSPDVDIQLVTAQIVKINGDDYYHVEAAGQEGYMRVDDLEYISDTIINSLQDTAERLDALEAALAKIDELENRIAELEANQATTEALTEAETAAIASEDPGTSEPFVLDAGTWIVGEDLPEGKYNIKCIGGTGTISFYDDYETKKEREYDYFEYYMMASDEYFQSLAALGQDMVNSMKALYTQSANNIRLENGNCIYLDSLSVQFTPVS